MNHYLDIRVLPDPEFKETVLMNALFAKLHRALVDVGQGEIGVSFPLQTKTLGELLRLHGSEAALTRLMAENWLKGLRDYTECSQVQAVPTTTQFRKVARVQFKSNPERLRRRSIANGKLSAEAALSQIPDSKAERTDLPFVQLKSKSTGQEFRLFIEQGPLQTQPSQGQFSDYGLSSTATIPHF